MTNRSGSALSGLLGGLLVSFGFVFVAGATSHQYAGTAPGTAISTPGMGGVPAERPIPNSSDAAQVGIPSRAVEQADGVAVSITPADAVDEAFDGNPRIEVMNSSFEVVEGHEFRENPLFLPGTAVTGNRICITAPLPGWSVNAQSLEQVRDRWCGKIMGSTDSENAKFDIAIMRPKR
jgi:hypothetical protein